MSDSPQYPGSPQPPAGGPPPFQPVQPAYQPVATPGSTPGPAAGFGGGSVPPPPPPVQGKSNTLKIILIILGVLVFLVLLVVGVIGYGVYRVAHSVHMDKNGSVSINGPGGIIASNNDTKFTADDLGTEIYPGAVPVKSGNFKMSLGWGSTMMATYTTPDSKEKVEEFYKSKLGDQATAMDFASVSMISLKKSSGEAISVTITGKGDKTQIQISHTTTKAK